MGRKQLANGPAHKFSHRDTEGFCFFLGEHVLFRIQADLSSDHVITFCTYDNIGSHRGSDHPRGGNDGPPLRQCLRDQLSAYVGETEIPAEVSIGEPSVIESEQV